MFEVLKVKEDECVQVVAKKLRDSKVRHAYVIDDKGAPVGVISVVDISNRVVAEGKSPDKICAKDVMSSPVETKDVNDSVKDAYELMVANKRYSLAVTDKGILYGILPMNEAVSFMMGREVKNEQS